MVDDPDRWTQVQTLFEQALERPPDERTAWLRAVCGDDPALYAEVAGLLDGDDRGVSLLEGRAADLFDPDALEQIVGSTPGSPGPRAPDRTGERVGPWQLQERIGEGGMGAVYAAERAEGGYEQTAAVKLIRPGMGSEAVIERFRAERQILARLRHPGIARLLDGGLTAEERPYFAMELVDGEPITAYCDRRILSLKARLELFGDVCEAVAYAHRSLVVHRDLKPSNILVTEAGEGERPAVKLLDFGIARLLATDDEAHLTRTGQRVLTPEYAAPEQVRGEAPTTATDVYALGGLLYRLLAGTRPVQTDGRTSFEVEQAVLEEQPRPPSHAAAEESAATRGLSLQALKRQLRGDLDTICLKALRKEPERRYGSAAELLADVRRHLQGLPVEARPASWRYRSGLFLKRHRVGAGATAAALLVGVALTAFYTVRLAGERDRAATEAATAQEVSAFLEGLLEDAIPAEAGGRELTATELLARGSTQIDTALADQPAVRTRLLGLMTRVYSSLGRFDEAIAHGRRALAQSDSVFGATHPETAEVQAFLARALAERGDYAEADSLLGLAVGTMRDQRGLDPGALGDVLAEWAWLRQELGFADEAIAINQELLAIRREQFGPRHPQTGVAHNNLGYAYYGQGRYDEAEPHYTEALAIQEETLGPDNPEVATTLNNLALLLSDRGDPEAAEPLYRRVLTIDRASLEPDHPFIATSLNNLAKTLETLGRYDEAEALFREAIAIRTRTLGPDHAMTAQSVNNLGYLLARRGDAEAAIPLLRQAEAVSLQAQGATHPATATYTLNLVRTLRQHGRVAEAARLLPTAIERYEAAFPSDGVPLAALREEQGMMAAAEGDPAQGLTLLQRARRLRLRTQQASDPDVLGIRFREALLHAQLGQCAEAREIEQETREAQTSLRASLRDAIATCTPT